MTWLLPDAVREAIASRGDFGASASFGLVTLTVLVVLLVEHEVLRMAAPGRAQLRGLFAAAIALSIPVVLIVGVRLAELTP